MLVVIKRPFKHNNVLMNMNGSQQWTKAGGTLESVADNTTLVLVLPFQARWRSELPVEESNVNINVEHQMNMVFNPACTCHVLFGLPFCSSLQAQAGGVWALLHSALLVFSFASVCVSNLSVCLCVWAADQKLYRLHSAKAVRLIFKRLKIGTNAAENVAAPPMSRCDDHHLFPDKCD